MSRHSRTRKLRALTVAATTLAPTLALAGIGAPSASAGPCSEMFGNFGSLLEGQTGAGMGSAQEALGSAGSLGSAAGSLGSLSNPLGSLNLSRSSSLVQQLETGSLGNGLSGSLDPVVGSVVGMPQWITGDQGTIPVLSGPTKIVQLLTGPTSPLDTPAKYGVGGTDLGIMWDNGSKADPEVLMAFGDTMGDCSIPGNQWRANLLFRTKDKNLDDGLTVSSVLTDGNGLAKQMVPRTGQEGEVTIIPTAGIAVDGVQYLRFMSVRHWGAPGSWDTNYSGLAYSEDNGETWHVDHAAARRITDFPTGGDAPGVDGKWFDAQMSAFVDGRDGYVYEYLTPSGRQGAARLARVAKADIRNPDAYTYYDGSSWSSSIADAKPVLPAWVSELSVQWHPGLNKFVSMYSSGQDSVLIRTADHPWGPWSRGTTLIDYSVLQGAYGGFIHPWSTGNDLYFVVTTWNSYNVYLAHTDLSKINLPGVAAPTAGNAQAVAAVQAQAQAQQTVTADATADGPINPVAPGDATDAAATPLTTQEIGTQVERTISTAEVTATNGLVPQE